MADIDVKRVEDIDYYTGQNAIEGIKFRTAGRALGVTAWGMNVLEIAPGCSGYPEHDHSKDGQEEVYVVLRGTAMLDVGGEKSHLEQGAFVRVGPSQKRKFYPGKDGVVLLALGATPGKAYEPRR